MRDLAPIAPIAHGNAVNFISSKVGGYTYSTFAGVDLGTLYVK